MEGLTKKTSKRKVFHWDINGTITATDTTEPCTVEENANMIISRSVFGFVAEDGAWKLNVADVYNRCGAPDVVTFYAFATATDKASYKQRAFTFTAVGNPGEKFSALVPAVVHAAYLFPSFLKAIETFPEAVHVVRTFGQDTHDVFSRLQKQYPTTWAKVSKGAPLSKDEIQVDGAKMSFAQFSEFLLETDKHVLIQENYDYWHANGRSQEYGKQLAAHPELDQIFFDDNPAWPFKVKRAALILCW